MYIVSVSEAERNGHIAITQRIPYSTVYMAYSPNLEPVSRQLTIVLGLAVVGFMAFGLALSFYRNALFEQTLENIQEQNNALRAKIDDGYRSLEYYQSRQYKDKYAKENLGLVRPTEKILIITNPVAIADVSTTNEKQIASEQQEAMYMELLRQMPVIEHWKLYLFHKENIENLKYAL